MNEFVSSGQGFISCVCFLKLLLISGGTMKKIVRIVLIALCAPLLSAIVSATPSLAAPGTLTETFTGATLSNPNNWLATSAGLTVHPCLTAATAGTVIPLSSSSLEGCVGTPDAAGSGALLLTTNGTYQAGTMLYKAAIPTSAGLDLSFYQAQYGGSGADGFSFFTQDGAIADVSVGADGGALGYGGFKAANRESKPGIKGGLFAVGFDAYGNASAKNEAGSQVRGGLLCSSETDHGFTPQALVVRGPDISPTRNGTDGYCYLDGKAIGSSYFGTSNSTRTSVAIPVRIIVDPATDANPQIHVYVWKSGLLNQNLSTADVKIEVAEPAQYKAAQTIKFGFSASTGGATNYHAVWGMNIAPANPAKSPTLYFVPDAVTVDATDPAIYTYKIYSDESKTVLVNSSTLSNFVAPVCTSAYTTSSAIGTTFPISCSGGAAGLYQSNHSATSLLTVIQGTPTLTPASRTISGVSGTAISGAALTAKKFRNTVTYSINPALPTGLTLNTATGAISGTPTSAIIGAFIVTATDGISSLISTVSMTITANNNTQNETKTVTVTETRTVIVNDTRTVIVNDTRTVIVNETKTAPADINGDSIISLLPASGYANDEITITGSFTHAITSIKVDGLLLAKNSWTQDATTIKFSAPGHNEGKVLVQISNGLVPEFSTLPFEYLSLKKLGIDLKIDSITCLGTFDKPCFLKPGSTQPVSFKLNSNALSPKSIKILKSWKLQTAKSVVVYGYASASGTAAANNALTKRRAAEVGAWVKKTWPNLTVKTVGQGTTINRLCKKFDNKCAMIRIVALAKK